MQSYGKPSNNQWQGAYQGQSGYGQSQSGFSQSGYGQAQSDYGQSQMGAYAQQGMQGMQNQGMWAGQGKGMAQQGYGNNMQGGQQKGWNAQQKGCPAQFQKGCMAQQKGGQANMQMQMQMQQQAQQQQQRGPPKREMDSLLEEIKAKQRLQEQNREMLKEQEERAAAAAAAAADIAKSHSAMSWECSKCGFKNNAQNTVCGGSGPMGCKSPAPSGGGAYNQQYGTSKSSMSGGAYTSQYGSSGGYTKSDDYPDRPSRPSGGVARPAFLYLKEFPSSMNEDAVCNLFSRYGIVTGVNILRGQEGQTISRGYVTMDTQENALRAKDALHDRDVDGVPLWIETAKAPPSMSECDFVETNNEKEGCCRIVVHPPIDRRRRRIIDLMAKYVSQEGHQFEMVIMEREPQDGNHPDFSFLYEHDSPENRYYRWRVFAFAQGDNYNAWRTQPHRIHDTGSAWWQPPFCEVSREAQLNRKTNFSAGPGGSSVTSDKANASSSLVEEVKNAMAKPEARVEEVEEVKPAPVSVVSKYPAGWTELDILEEKERSRLEEKATQERQRRDRDKKGIAGGKRLTDSDWDRLEQLLRSVKTARSGILEAMVFCLDKSDCAIEITECITESLTIVETDMSVKLARLLLVSDVLHNTSSSKPAAWAYRREFERSLPDILEHLFLTLDRMESKLDVERYRQSVCKVLSVWEDWGLFAPQYTRGLEAAVVVGVKSLRALRSKGDDSREPPWIELKLNEWRRQHFSQLEKMCRTRGLRCSTAHLEATRTLTLEDVRREWLVDRLVCYELHWHEKEQAREKDKNAGRSKQISAEDIDGESIECDIDGFPLSEGDLDGEAVDLRDIDVIVDLMELARVIPENNLARCSPDVLRYGNQAPASPPMDPMDTNPEPADSKAPEEDSPPFEDMLDIERPGDHYRLDNVEDNAESLQESHRTSSTKESDGKKEIDHDVLRDIELEVMELRASLETQGLFKDAIQDICDEKRRNLIKEQEAILASPMNTGGLQMSTKSSAGRHVEDESDSDSAGKEREKEREKEKEKLRREEEERKEKDREKDKDKEKSKKDKGKKKDKDKDKDTSKKEKRSESQPRARQRSRSCDRGRDKHRTRSREKEKEKEKDRGNKKRVSRSRSREQTKKKMRR
mmetsp:Transcript_71873/g.113871  ORF Transcript_71873/g.113871 Transcript_71873/m.113871 type:complete len:1139 (+) Transcript_71873:152-3568(+)